MYFNKSYATAPPGVYFNPATGGLTVMTWFKAVNQINYWQRIIDFGNGAGVDNILLGNYATSRKMIVDSYPGGFGTESNFSVTLNVWVHLAITYTPTTVKMYFNGTLDSAATGYLLN